MDKKNIEAIYPLTSMQQTLLLHAIQNPEHDLGRLQIQFDIRGTVDINLLKQAWQALLNRHQVLRTAIYWENLEQPLQMVQRQVLPVWEFLDWRSLSRESQKQKISDLKSAAQQQVLTLNKTPLTHVTLIQQADGQYHFICYCHHILLDGWSGNLIVKELFVLYEMQHPHSTNRQSLPSNSYKTLKIPTAFKFQDYVGWVQAQDIERAKTFWKQQLSELSTHPLWLASKTSTEATYEKQNLIINQTTTQLIQQLCSTNKITLNIFFQGIWSLLLSKLQSRLLSEFLSGDSNDTDVVFGVTTSGRTTELKGLENAIGMFSNVLPLYLKIKPQEHLILWLKSLAVQQAEISSFDYVTLAQIQTWRSTQFPLNIQSLFVFENHTQGSLFSNDVLTVTGYESGFTTNYPLTVAIQPGKEMIVTLVYDTCYLQKEQVAEILKNWNPLIARSIEDPQQALSTLQQSIKMAIPNLSDITHADTTKSPESEIAQAEITKPVTPVEKELARLWMDILNQPGNSDSTENIPVDHEAINIGRDDNFFDLGGRSIMAAFLISRIQDIFQVRLPIYRLFEYPTLKKLSVFIQSQKEFKLPSVILDASHKEANKCMPFASYTHYTQQKSWNLEQKPDGVQGLKSDLKQNDNTYHSLVPIQPKGTKPPLFCVPPAGNTALTYVNLASHLDSEQPLYGLNPLGLEDGSRPQYSVEEMASHYLMEIQQFQPKGPYQLAGTCFGGQVAFEMAQQLKAQGSSVQLLVLFDPVAPRIIPYKYLIYLFKREKSPLALSRYIASRLFRRLKTKFSNQSSNLIKHSLEQERLEKLMEAHTIAMRHYIPKAYAGDLTIFRSGENYKLEKKGIGHLAVPWSEYTTGKYDYHVISGDHADMITGENLGIMTMKLKACIDGLKVNLQLQINTNSMKKI